MELMTHLIKTGSGNFFQKAGLLMMPVVSPLPAGIRAGPGEQNKSGRGKINGRYRDSENNKTYAD